MAGNKQVRKNGEITAREVRVIDAEGEQVGVLSIRDAIATAEEVGLDLVEISPNAEPPVCRIMDFGRYKFELAKKASSAKKKQKQIQVKEIKFRPGTEEGDYNVKLKRLMTFLNNGDKVKITLRFRGREMAHRDLGLALLNRVRDDLEEIGVVEQRPALEGRQMVMVMSARKQS